MKTSLFLICFTAVIVIIGADVAQNFIHTSQNYTLPTEDSSEMNNVTTLASYQSTSSYSYQQSNINLSANNLQKPHVLSIKTSGNTMTGTITVNGKVVKQIDTQEVEIELSPYLSIGENKVKISGSYSPKSSSLNLEFNAPGANMNQLISGDGVVDSQLNIFIE